MSRLEDLAKMAQQKQPNKNNDVFPDYKIVADFSEELQREVGELKSTRPVQFVRKLGGGRPFFIGAKKQPDTLTVVQPGTVVRLPDVCIACGNDEFVVQPGIFVCRHCGQQRAIVNPIQIRDPERHIELFGKPTEPLLTAEDLFQLSQKGLDVAALSNAVAVFKAQGMEDEKIAAKIMAEAEQGEIADLMADVSRLVGSTVTRDDVKGMMSPPQVRELEFSSEPGKDPSPPKALKLEDILAMVKS